MSDENTINIEHNKHLLDEIREQRNVRDSTILGRGHATSRTGSDNEDTSGNQRTVDRDTIRPTATSRGTQANRTTSTTAERLDSRGRPTRGTGEPTSERGTSGDRRPQEGIKPIPIRPDDAPRFRLKIPFPKTNPEKEKLFTKQEADDELEKLTRIYYQGSGLLDDILEIVVKDHEPVQIWQLSEDEASTLAMIHLEQAKHDKAAARSARKLLEIYDRLYMYIIALPRLKASHSYVKEHHGFSFR